MVDLPSRFRPMSATFSPFSIWRLRSVKRVLLPILLERCLASISISGYYNTIMLINSAILGLISEVNMYKLDEKKYKNAILYFCKNVGKRGVWGKKKFYKLFYYLDFDYFEQHEKPITGDVYHKLPMGPAPTYFDAMVNDLSGEKKIIVSERPTGTGYNDTVVYTTNASPDMSVFSEEEKKMLKAVVRKYGGKSGTQLEKLSHSEAPYKAVEEGEEIPLELAHYRGKY